VTKCGQGTQDIENTDQHTLDASGSAENPLLLWPGNSRGGYYSVTEIEGSQVEGTEQAKKVVHAEHVEECDWSLAEVKWNYPLSWSLSGSSDPI
jgi:hypothetical protein